jgi:hypothetical protein
MHRPAIAQPGLGKRLVRHMNVGPCLLPAWLARLSLASTRTAYMSCTRLHWAQALLSFEARRAAAGARAFQRVKAEEWLGHKAARDNSYQATFGGGGWGAGAQEVLGKARRARLAAFSMSSRARLSRVAPFSCHLSPWARQPRTPSAQDALRHRAGCRATIPDATRAYLINYALSGVACERAAPAPRAGPRQGLPAREDEEEARHVPRRRHRQRRQLVQV